jgi:hypothetical protein
MNNKNILCDLKYSLKIQKSSIYYILFVFLFLFLNEFYFNYFVLNILASKIEFITDTANLHDHLIYITFIRFISEGQDIFVFGNNFGIASIYYVLGNMFNIDNYIILAHYINIIVYLFIALFTFKVFKLFNISLILTVFFTFNPANFYFLSLINKDSFSILFVLLFIYYIFKKKYIILTFIILFSLVIRMQLPIFAITLLFLVNYDKLSLSKKIFILYFLSSLGAVLLENTINLLAMDRMGTSLGIGMTKIIRELNSNYGLGSLLLNPIKIIQYFYDYSVGYTYLFNFSQLYLFRVKDFLNLIFLPVSLFSLSIYFLNKKMLNTGSNIFLLVIISFFTVWLINPTVNYRYIGIFLPYILVPGIYATLKLFRRNN